MKPTWCMAALVIAVGVSGGIRALDIGERAGDVALTMPDGAPLTMSNYAERKGTVVVFLSARCAKTEDAMKEMLTVYQKYRRLGVLFVGIFANPGETGDEVRRFAQRVGCTFPVYLEPSGTAVRQFGAQVTPEMFLLDEASVLRSRGGLGPIGTPGGLDDAIALLLARRSVPPALAQADGTPIGTPGEPRDGRDRREVVAFSSELVFERIPNVPGHHCSTIAEASNGDLVCVWYGGTYESADDQVLFLARMAKGERRWSTPEVVVRNPGQPPGNAVVFRDGLKRLWIVWGRMEASRPIRAGGGWGQCSLLGRVSEDCGASWSEDRAIPGTFGWLPRNLPITLRTGELALPISGTVDGAPGSFLLTTKDNGATWERSGVAAGGSQPTVIERSDGTFLALMREEPRILQSTSHDGGKTWTTPFPTPLRNPDAGIAMRKLHNGHLVLVFNDATAARTPLSIARSVDEGKTWQKPLALESNPGEYSYPSLLQAEDGTIHVTYTFNRYAIKHAAFNEAWMTNGESTN